MEIGLGNQIKKNGFRISAFHIGRTEAVDKFLENIIQGAEEFSKDHNGYLRFDARTSLQATSQFKISLIGQNISNEIYAQRIGKLEAPFNLSLRLDYTPFHK